MTEPIPSAPAITPGASSPAGRDRALQEVLEWLHSACPPCILWIGGRPGIGKTRFMARVTHCLDEDSRFVVVSRSFRGGNPNCQWLAFLAEAVRKGSAGLGVEIGLGGEDDHVRLMALLQGGRSLPPEGDGGPPRLVFLLDGLDEMGADGARLSQQLVHLCRMGGATWICSASTDPCWQGFVEQVKAETLWPRGELPPLDDPAVRQMVRSRLGAAFDSLPAAWLDSLVERSEGSPWYVMRALEAVGGDSLPALPRGWRRMARSTVERHLSEGGEATASVLAFLAVAGQALKREALHVLVRGKDGAAAEARVDEVLARLAPLLVSPRADYFALADGWLRQVLEEIEAVASRVPDARERLLEWWSGWHLGPTGQCAAQHARVLREVGQWESLERLAHDRCFRLTVAEACPGATTCVLEPLRQALDVALERGDIMAATRLAIEHAGVAAARSVRSPLQVLRHEGVSQALRSCEQMPAEARIPWSLLLAWELEETGRRAEAVEVLEGLERDAVKVGQWQGTYAALVLERLWGLVGTAAVGLPAEILDEASVVLLAERLARAGDGDAALCLARSHHHALTRATGLRQVGVVLHEAGDDVAALEVLAEAGGALEEGRGSCGERARALCELGVVEARCAGGLPQARRHLGVAALLVGEVADEAERSLLLAMVACGQARCGDASAAESTLAGLARAEEREEAWFGLAHEQMACGEMEGAARALALVPPSSGFWEPAESLLEDVRLARAVEACLAEGQGEEALALARRITPVGVRTNQLRALAHGQARGGSARTAFGVAREAVLEANHDLRTLVLERVVEWLVHRGDLDLALEGARHVDGEAVRVEVLCGLAARLRAAGAAEVADDCLQGALSCAREILEDAARVRALCVVALALLPSGEGTGSRVLDEALGTARSLVSGDGRDRCVREIARSLAARGDLEAARRAAGTLTSSLGRVETLRSLAEAGQEDSGQARESLAAGLVSVGDPRGDSLRAQALGIIVDGQVLRGELGGALRTAELLPVCEHRVTALVRVAVAMARAGDREASLAWRAAHRAVFSIPDDRQRPEVLRTMLLALAEAGGFDVALAWADELEDEWQRERLHVEIRQKKAIWLAGQGDVVAALEAARTVGELRERLEVEREIARTQAESGRLDEALETWRRGVQEAKGLEPQQSLPLVRAAALAAASCGAVEEGRAMLVTAVQEARSVPQAWDRARILHSLCLAQVEVGDLERAQRTAGMVPDEHQRTSALREIAEAMATLGRHEEALTLVEAFQDDHERKVGLRRLAKSQARAGQAAAALATVERMGSGSDQDDARVGVAIETARRGDFREAEETVSAIDSAWYRATALREVAAAWVRAENPGGGWEVFARAVEAGRHAWPDKRPAALRDLALAIHEAGDADQGAVLLAEAVAALSGVTDRRARTEEIRALVGAALSLGAFDLAEEVVHLADGRERSSLAGRMAVAAAQRGQGARAVRLVEGIAHRREEHVLAVARALMEAGDEASLLCLLPMASCYPGSAFHVAAYLARLRPEQAGAIARALA